MDKLAFVREKLDQGQEFLLDLLPGDALGTESLDGLDAPNLKLVGAENAHELVGREHVPAQEESPDEFSALGVHQVKVVHTLVQVLRVGDLVQGHVASARIRSRVRLFFLLRKSKKKTKISR